MTIRACAACMTIVLCEVLSPAYLIIAARTPTVTVRRVPYNGIQPEVVTDGAGVLHMVYFAGLDGGFTIFY